MTRTGACSTTRCEIPPARTASRAASSLTSRSLPDVGCATLARRGKESVVDETSAMTRRMLEDYDTVAVVGLSTDPTKAAHSVPAAMQAYGWRVIPVNPHADELLGERVYRRVGRNPQPVAVIQTI